MFIVLNNFNNGISFFFIREIEKNNRENISISIFILEQKRIWFFSGKKI